MTKLPEVMFLFVTPKLPAFTTSTYKKVLKYDISVSTSTDIYFYYISKDLVNL